MPQDNDQQIIEIHQQRLAILKQKEALYGLEVPPHILMEIKKIETELQKLGVKIEDSVQDNDEASLSTTQSKPPKTKPSIFISYSHKDEAEKEALVTQLQVLQYAAELTDVWYDDLIQAGSDWETEIEQAMAHATIAILLISANSLTSDFILRKEVKTLLERRKRDGLVVYPIIAKPCAWQTVGWLNKMNVKPKNGRPVWREQGAYADEALAEIAQDIASILKK